MAEQGQGLGREGNGGRDGRMGERRNVGRIGGF